MKWLSKHTIFKIPVMGWMMRMALDVPVRRGERESAIAALAECRDRLARRVSVMIFPEGTRSRTDELLPFKDGAFHLAIESQRADPADRGRRHAARAWRRASFAFRRAHAKARVLAPIATDGLTLADVPALRDRARATIDAARRALQRELRRGARMTPRLSDADRAPATRTSSRSGSRAPAALAAVLARCPGDMRRARRRREDGPYARAHGPSAPIRRAGA